MAEKEGGKAALFKVHFHDNDVSSSRTFQFKVESTVSQAVEQVRVKCAPDKTLEKWGFYVTYEEKGIGFWLDNDKPLSAYNLTGASIEFKSQLTALSVTDLDGTTRKKVRVDLTGTVEDTLPSIGKRFGVEPDNISEFALQIQRKPDGPLSWLNMKENYINQRVNDSQTLVFRKKFFVTDALVKQDQEHAALLHLVYLESRYAIINGFHPVTHEQAVQFAALQMQITYGNYDPLLHVAGFLSLKDFLPESAAKTLYVEEDVYMEHRKCKDMDEVEAKYKYVKKCSKVPTFGATLCFARERSSTAEERLEHDVLFGVNADAILILHHISKEIVGKNLLVEVLGIETGESEKVLILKFKSRKREFILSSTEDANLMRELIVGYKDFQRLRRKEKFIGQSEVYSAMPRSLGKESAFKLPLYGRSVPLDKPAPYLLAPKAMVSDFDEKGDYV